MSDKDIEFRIGHEEVVLRRRYEVLSIVNDLLIGLWFVVRHVHIGRVGGRGVETARDF